MAGVPVITPENKKQQMTLWAKPPGEAAHSALWLRDAVKGTRANSIVSQTPAVTSSCKCWWEDVKQWSINKQNCVGPHYMCGTL